MRSSRLLLEPLCLLCLFVEVCCLLPEVLSLMSLPLRVSLLLSLHAEA